jgi:hypothetical protein
MKITILTFLFSLSFGYAYSQYKKGEVNSIGLSVPVILNNSNGVFYSLGNRKEPSGKAFSYGLNLNYTRAIYKNWFATIGVGYFKQSFNIIRPYYFDGDTITNLLYSTKKYNYHCLNLSAGVGYSISINKKFRFNGFASINLLNSFKQDYTPTGYSGFEHKKVQKNKESTQIGYMVNVSPGIEYMISKKMSIGANVVIPVITKWKSDEIFIKSLFGDDSQKIAENRFTIGTLLNCKYHF